MNDNIKALVRAEKGIEVSMTFIKIKGILILINHQSQKILKEKLNFKAQTELNEVVVESWKKKEIQNIKKNPEDYINKES